MIIVGVFLFCMPAKAVWIPTSTYAWGYDGTGEYGDSESFELGFPAFYDTFSVQAFIYVPDTVGGTEEFTLDSSSVPESTCIDFEGIYTEGDWITHTFFEPDFYIYTQSTSTVGIIGFTYFDNWGCNPIYENFALYLSRDGTTNCMIPGNQHSTTTCAWEINYEGQNPYEAESDDVIRYMPTIAWGNATDTGNGTATSVYSDTVLSYIGEASSTFPLCIVTPFIDLLDDFRGMTDGTLESQSLIIGTGFSTGTIELDPDREEILSESGSAANIRDYVWALLGSICYLLLGWYILNDLFLKPHAEAAENEE